MKAFRHRHHGLVLAVFISLVNSQIHAGSPLDTNWDNRFGPIGVNGQVNAITQVGSNIYVTGEFTLAGAVQATNIAMWDGARWWAMGTGLNFDGYALANDGSNVYAGGGFTAAGGVTADRVAKWNGTNWSPLGNPTLGEGGDSVRALLFQSGVLYAAGFFPTLSGVAVTNIAQWNGTKWQSVGAGLLGTVYALASDGVNLYAGGENFSIAGDVAKWNGTGWSALGTGVSDGVFTGVATLAVLGGDLVAAGDFAMAGSVRATNIARWTGSQWSALAGGLSDVGSITQVSALLVDGANLYVAGNFNAAGSVTVNAVAKWNGASWSTVGTVGPEGGGLPAGSAYALAGNGTNLIIGGNFISVDDTNGLNDIVFNNMVRWDGQQWHGFGDGVGGTGGTTLQIAVLKVVGGNVYIGGSLPSVADLNAQNIARWDGTHWNQLGPGLTNSFGQGAVTAIESVAGQIYAGGSFIRAGTVGVTNIARWDGTNWFTAGTFDNQVNALAAVGTNLYAGGVFVHSGSAVVNYIALFNGTNWVPVGGGVNGSGVDVLTAVGTNLCIGGQFTQAGSVSATNIALWNGVTWSALGPGLGQPGDAVQAIEPSPDGQFIYATGDFQSAGSTNWISRWNGQAWTTIGVANAYVDAMAFVGNDLFVGGGFTSINGVAAASVAGWDGTNWFALGDGISIGVAAVYALGSGGGDLFVGGLFEDAGDKPDERFGIYHTGLVQTQPALPNLTLAPTTTGNGALTISWPDSAIGYILESNGNLENESGWQTFTGTITDTNGKQTAQISIAPGNSFFRLHHP